MGERGRERDGKERENRKRLSVSGKKGKIREAERGKER